MANISCIGRPEPSWRGLLTVWDVKDQGGVSGGALDRLL